MTSSPSAPPGTNDQLSPIRSSRPPLTLSLNEAIVESTHKRYVETAKYVHDLLTDPAGTNAFRTACRVRLLHGFVRAEIERHVD